MKKYKVSVVITTSKTIFYEVEAESRSEIFNRFYDDPTEDLGKYIDEKEPEILDREIGYIEEV